ncbi:Phosphoglycolate phosphatase, HAD superfamily [Desulfuromusa kysingii]|uniref:Phosphoglycolate phosphatase, HAD superfamily n=1 Tax=Desulfuromusa kysingii TaxID=37625 RepID=A0A1H3W6V8_9BACT|nr:HAD family hydrolase [Desulfuromusa kysingii]SDZ82817.1 Phosphoglycolate phosphatase, HAD superfamily [Desulfuromusa kysingii]
MSKTRQKNAIKAVLFDLDGTLLRAQMREFIPRYLRALSAYCADTVAPEKFAKTLHGIIRDLIHTEGDGLRTNEERVYSKVDNDLAISESKMRECLAQFEKNDLPGLQSFIRPIPLAKQIIKDCHAAGVPLVLATNPVFPMFMIKARMQWAELEEESFAFMTSYENSYYCKPQSGYFEGIAAQLGLASENCLMVGNDINHDLAAGATGMKTYLVDTWLVDRDGPEWPCENRGDHSSLQKFLQQELDY